VIGRAETSADLATGAALTDATPRGMAHSECPNFILNHADSGGQEMSVKLAAKVGEKTDPIY
jgi:hypothetical protein